MEEIKTQQRFEFLIVTLDHWRSNWKVAQAAVGGQREIRNRDTPGGRSQCSLWHCCFPRSEKEGRHRAGGEIFGGEKFGAQHTSVNSVCESVFEGLFSSSTTQSSSETVRCRPARSEPC